MSDVLDQAQAIEERERDSAIAMARAPVRPSGAASAFECRLCDEPIEEERRQALPGVQTCVECQESRERVRRLFGEGR